MRIILIAWLYGITASFAADALRLQTTIPLLDVRGRFDHFDLDTQGRRLFIAALGNNSLEVIDLATGKRLKSVPDMSKPTGVLYLPEPNQVLVANGDDGTLKILNGTTFKIELSLGGFEDADNLRFDPESKLVWLGYDDGAGGRLITVASHLFRRGWSTPA